MLPNRRWPRSERQAERDAIDIDKADGGREATRRVGVIWRLESREGEIEQEREHANSKEAWKLESSFVAVVARMEVGILRRHHE
ncbi:unnamed protein product [Linum trigynum]|uniref:Uncharacterized protein n=1 Tax=Linum trigynum TaxID=586398 RepID=A0AAV2FVR1_9ROSI